MPVFGQGQTWRENPNVMPGVNAIEGWGRSIGLGKSGKYGKQLMKQMMLGDYGGLAGGILSPIHDTYETQRREQTRGNQMGANAFYQGAQPALMAGIENDARRQMAEGEGMAVGAAIPQLFGQASGMFQNAKNAKNQMQMEAMRAGLTGRMNSGQFYQTPGLLDKINQSIGTLGNIASFV